jgi:tetratricopeptide (TPR) repeat protein
MKVALRGLERHPHHPDAHDLLARLYVDDGELEKAYDEWDMVVRLNPNHAGAQQGMGYVRFQQGRLEEAERHLSHAASLDPADERNLSALAYVREAQSGNGASPPETFEVGSDVDRPSEPGAAGILAGETVVTRDAFAPVAHAHSAEEGPRHRLHPSQVFRDLIVGNDQAGILLDDEGLVLAGEYFSLDGQDIAQEVGANLSGISEEAGRAMRHLEMGAWTSLVFETEGATLAMAPGPDGGLLLVAASRATPLGFVRRLLERVGDSVQCSRLSSSTAA